MVRLWAGLWRDVVLNGLFASPLVPARGRWLLLRLYGLDVAPCKVDAKVWFGSRRVTLGRGTYVNRGCMFTTTARVTLGEKVNVGMDVLFVTGSHAVAPMPRRAGAPTSAPIVVGDGAWIGARAILQPGVTVGEGCVVLAGAVVGSDCEPHGVYGGVPAQRLRDVDIIDLRDPAVVGSVT